MRGKVPSNKGQRMMVRITPAYAGKRKIHDEDEENAEDHPRLCGEK